MRESLTSSGELYFRYSCDPCSVQLCLVTESEDDLSTAVTKAVCYPARMKSPTVSEILAPLSCLGLFGNY